MKKQIFYIFLFLFVFFVIDQIIFRIYKYERCDQPYSYGALSKLYSGTINADIVFFGSSRTLLHLDPAVIEKNTHLSAYNLALDGTNIYQSFFTLEEYLLHNRRPKLIIFEGDLSQLDENNINLRFEKNRFREYCYLSEHTSNLYDFSLFQKISHALVKSQFAANNPYVFYTFFTKTIFGKKEREEKIRDFGDWVFSSGANLKKGTHITKPIERNDYKLKISVDRRKKFEEIADWANKRQITLLFYSPPISFWKKNDSMESGICFFRELANKFHYVEYVDYSFDYDFSSDRLWWNTAHMNIDGAYMLSQKITGKISQILNR